MKCVLNLRAICIIHFSVSIHSIDFKAFTQDDFNVSNAVYPGTSTSISTFTPKVFEEEGAEEDCTIVDCIIPPHTKQSIFNHTMLYPLVR